jgi:hypothetical protein
VTRRYAPTYTLGAWWSSQRSRKEIISEKRGQYIKMYGTREKNNHELSASNTLARKSLLLQILQQALDGKTRERHAHHRRDAFSALDEDFMSKHWQRIVHRCQRGFHLAVVVIHPVFIVTNVEQNSEYLDANMKSQQMKPHISAAAANISTRMF